MNINSWTYPPLESRFSLWVLPKICIKKALCWKPYIYAWNHYFWPQKKYELGRVRAKNGKTGFFSSLRAEFGESFLPWCILVLLLFFFLVSKHRKLWAQTKIIVGIRLRRGAITRLEYVIGVFDEPDRISVEKVVSLNTSLLFSPYIVKLNCKNISRDGHSFNHLRLFCFHHSLFLDDHMM